MEKELLHGKTPFQSIDTLVAADKLRLLVHQSYPGLFVSPAAALLLCWVLWDYSNATTLLAWLGILFGITLLRSFLFFTRFRTERSTQEVLRLSRTYILTLTASTLVWGWVYCSSCQMIPCRGRHSPCSY